jgi:hypothetical protein
MAGRDETSTVTHAARAAETTRVAQVASLREQALVTFYDRHSAVGLRRIRLLLNDVLVGDRRTGSPRARRFMKASTHDAAAPAPARPIPTVSETNDSDHDHPGIIDHSRHVSSIGRR